VGAIAPELVRQYQMKVLLVPTCKLVSDLLVAKFKLELPRLLERLHKFDVICCDDIGYVQHSAEEMEVLIAFLAERYQQNKTLALTSNIVFSEWNRIFKNPVTAMAAVDLSGRHRQRLDSGACEVNFIRCLILVRLMESFLIVEIKIPSQPGLNFRARSRRRAGTRPHISLCARVSR
jgi:hypothetical protein